MIYVKPIGGLCNRMRVIASALKLAQITNQKVEVFWSLDESLNCSFNVLFERIKGVSISESKRRGFKKVFWKYKKFWASRKYINIWDIDVANMKGGGTTTI